MIDERHRYMLADGNYVKAHAAARRETAEIYQERLSQIRQMMSDKELIQKLAQLAAMVAEDATGVLEAADYTEHPGAAIKMFGMVLKDLSDKMTSLLVTIDVLDYLKMESFKQDRAYQWVQLLAWKRESQ